MMRDKYTLENLAILADALSKCDLNDDFDIRKPITAKYPKRYLQ